MKYLFLLITFTLMATSGLAQTKITIDATGEVHIPADLVIIQINITLTDTMPQVVFEKHKTREKVLADLILEKGIDTDNLRFQPMNISANMNRTSESGRRVYRSNQHVSLTLDDFELFEELQVFLIENGFDTFSGRFSSTKLDEAEEEALQLALKNARAKAGLIADTLGKSVSSVKSIHHGTAPVTSEFGREASMLRADSGSLIEFDQKVRVKSTVIMEFEAE